MWDIKDNGNGTYNYNGVNYTNKESAEWQRDHDMYEEDEYYRNLGKKNNNTNQPGCLSTLVGIGGIAFGIAFGLKGIIIALILIVLVVIIFASLKSKKENNSRIVNDAWNCYNQNRPTEAFSKVKDLGDDCPEAACLLAFMYYTGQGCDADVDKALHYAKIGKKVDVDSQALYGTILYHNSSSEKDKQLAFQELIVAKTLGSKLSNLRLGEIAVLENYAAENTVEDLKIAGENGYNYSYYLLARIYLEGIGSIPKNEEKGLEYMKKAAELNIDNAIAFFNAQAES